MCQKFAYFVIKIRHYSKYYHEQLLKQPQASFQEARNEKYIPPGTRAVCR